MLVTAWRARRRYDVAQVDVFSGPAFRWAESVTWLLARMGKPVVLVLRGGNLPEFGRRRSGRVGRLLRRAAIVVSPSEYLRRALGDHRGDIRVIPNAIELSQHHARERTAPAPRLVWVRAFHEIYNPVMAIEALSAVRRAGVDARLVMAGPDKGDGSLERAKAAAVALSLEPHVTFEGRVPKDKIPSLLSGGDIFLNTANIDNAPVTVIEALASGLCVVSTDVGGMPDLLRSGTDALLVPRGDSTAMGQAVLRLLSEPGLAARLSREGRQTAAAFDWTHVIDAWEQTLHEAAARG